MLQPAGTSTHFRTYATTELLTILFTTELARRLAGSGVTANAADPGFARTGLGRDAPAGFRVFLTLARPFQLSATKAADTPVHLATTPSLTEVSGGYFSKRRPGTRNVIRAFFIAKRTPPVAGPTQLDAHLVTVLRGRHSTQRPPSRRRRA